MEFWKAIVGLLRHRFIGPPLLLLSTAVGLGAYLLLPAAYVADASLVLAAPVNGGTVGQGVNRQPGLTNPFLSFNDALKTGASIVILSMNTQDVWTELGAPKDGPTTIVIDDGRSNPNVLDISGPYIYIQVQSDSAQRTTAVLEAARERVAAELFKWQKALGAPPSTFITSTDIVPPAEPQADGSRNLQAAIGGFAGTLLAGLGVAYAVLRRRLPAAAPARRAPSAERAGGVRGTGDAGTAGAGQDPPDSSSTMEFPAYQASPPAPGGRKASNGSGEE